MKRCTPLTCGALLLLLLLLVGCEKETKWVPATQVVVTLHSDFGSELASVEAVIYDALGERRGDSHVFELSSGRTLPLSFSVFPSLPETTQFLVELAGRDAKQNQLAQTKAIVTFVSRASVAVELWLLADCKGRMCAASEACTATDARGNTACSEVPILETHPVVPGQELVGATFDSGPVESSDASGVEGKDAQLEPDAGLLDGGDQPALDGMSPEPAGPCLGNPSRVLCLDSVLHRCNALGESAAREECANTRQCQLGIANQACAPCDPGSFRCTGVRLDRCANDGSKWELSATCDTEALCNAVAGSCTPGACSAATRVCMGDDLYGCSQDLTQLMRIKPCDSGLCDQVHGECDVCSPNARSCAAGAAEVCDGQGQTLTHTPCMGDTPKCNAGQCVQCVAAADCPVPGNSCMQASCSAITARCGMTNKAAHQPCAGGVCNGSGACVTCVNDTDCKQSNASKCSNSRCVQCKGNDCAAGYECSLGDNTCRKVSIAGTGTSCLSTGAATGGMCGSYFCGVTSARFHQAFEPASVCGPDAAFMCAGSLVQITTQCAVENALSPNDIADTTACIKRNSTVQMHPIGDACIACFVSAEKCCRDNSTCFSECLINPGTVSCDALKRSAGCTSALFSCSGLPNPL